MARGEKGFNRKIKIEKREEAALNDRYQRLLMAAFQIKLFNVREHSLDHLRKFFEKP